MPSQLFSPHFHHKEVSENRDTPQSSLLAWDFHHPAIGVPHGNPPKKDQRQEPPPRTHLKSIKACCQRLDSGDLEVRTSANAALLVVAGVPGWTGQNTSPEPSSCSLLGEMPGESIFAIDRCPARGYIRIRTMLQNNHRTSKRTYVDPIPLQTPWTHPPLLLATHNFSGLFLYVFPYVSWLSPKVPWNPHVSPGKMVHL